MCVRDGFLLIELLVAISIFVLFATSISRLQLESLKTGSLATRRMRTLHSITDCLENLKIDKNYKILEKNDAYKVKIEQIPIKITENHMFNFVKIIQ